MYVCPIHYTSVKNTSSTFTYPKSTTQIILKKWLSHYCQEPNREYDRVLRGHAVNVNTEPEPRSRTVRFHSDRGPLRNWRSSAAKRPDTFKLGQKLPATVGQVSPEECPVPIGTAASDGHFAISKIKLRCVFKLLICM